MNIRMGCEDRGKRDAIADAIPDGIGLFLYYSQELAAVTPPISPRAGFHYPPHPSTDHRGVDAWHPLRR